MRSRYGSSYFLFRISLILLFNSLALNASEYLISYRYVVKNAILYNEKLQISHAMTKCYSPISLKSQLILKNYNNNLQETISKNQEKFINFIHKIGIEVNHQDETINAIYSGTTILTFRTTCFKVDFNENFAKITALK